MSNATQQFTPRFCNYAKADSFEFCALHKWPVAITKASLFEPPTKGVGPGELSCVAALLGLDKRSLSNPKSKDFLMNFVSGQKDRFDLTVPSEIDGNKINEAYVGHWEVKAPDINSEIRPGAEGLGSMAKAYRFFEEAAWQINDFMEAIDKEDLFVDLQKIISKKELQKIVTFSSIDVPRIVDGELPKSRIFGSKDGKRLGLIQVASLLQKCKSDKTVDVKFEKDVSGNAPIELYVMMNERNVFSDTKIVKEKMSLTDLQYVAERYLTNDSFKDPTTIEKKFLSLSMASCVFPNTKGVILVNANEFMIIPTEKLNSVMTFSRVSQKKPKFKTIFKSL